MNLNKWNIFCSLWGSGCGFVGRAVASYTRRPWYQSSHWQSFMKIILTIEKTKLIKKRPEIAKFKNIFLTKTSNQSLAKNVKFERILNSERHSSTCPCWPTRHTNRGHPGKVLIGNVGQKLYLHFWLMNQPMSSQPSGLAKVCIYEQVNDICVPPIPHLMRPLWCVRLTLIYPFFG